MDVFGQGGGKSTAGEMGIPFLGELALDPEIRIGGDSGSPIVLKGENDPRAQAFRTLAQNVVERVTAIGPQTGPNIEISD